MKTCLQSVPCFRLAGRPVLGSRTGQGTSGIRRPEHTLQNRQRGATAPPRIRRRNGDTRRRITGLPRRRPPSDLPAQRRRNGVPDCRQRRTGETRSHPPGSAVPTATATHRSTPRTSSRAADSHSATAPHGYHDANGIPTPKNARGDYYVDDPATGKRAHFDKDGNPITAARSVTKTPPPVPVLRRRPTSKFGPRRRRRAKTPRGDGQSVQPDQRCRAKLSEALLNAHATTADGQQKLQAIHTRSSGHQ